MRQLLTLFIAAISFGAFAQGNISIKEENYSYSIGAKNSLIVTIPNTKKEIVEKELKTELKSWGGKLSGKKGEYSTFQSSVKKIFEGKTFDAYAKIFQAGTDIKVAVAIDLGGAFLTSDQHPSQFNEMRERLYNFAVTAGTAAIKDDVKNEEKALKTLEKEQKAIEKSISSEQKNIESYKKKITDSEKKIDSNKEALLKKKADVENQGNKIKEIQKTKIK